MKNTKILSISIIVVHLFFLLFLAWYPVGLKFSVTIAFSISVFLFVFLTIVNKISNIQKEVRTRIYFYIIMTYIPWLIGLLSLRLAETSDFYSSQFRWFFGFGTYSLCFWGLLFIIVFSIFVGCYVKLLSPIIHKHLASIWAIIIVSLVITYASNDALYFEWTIVRMTSMSYRQFSGFLCLYLLCLIWLYYASISKIPIELNGMCFSTILNKMQCSVRILPLIESMFYLCIDSYYRYYSSNIELVGMSHVIVLSIFIFLLSNVVILFNRRSTAFLYFVELISCFRLVVFVCFLQIFLIEILYMFSNFVHNNTYWSAYGGWK